MRAFLMLLLAGLGFALGRLYSYTHPVPPPSTLPTRQFRAVERRSTGENAIATPENGTAQSPKSYADSIFNGADLLNGVGSERRFSLERMRITSAIGAAQKTTPRFQEEYSELLGKLNVDEKTAAALLDRVADLTLLKFQYAFAMAEYEKTRQDIELIVKGSGEDTLKEFQSYTKEERAREQLRDIDLFCRDQGVAISDSDRAKILTAIQISNAYDADRVHFVGGPFTDPPHNDSGPLAVMVPRFGALKAELLQNVTTLKIRMEQANVNQQAIEVVGRYFQQKADDYDKYRSSAERALRR